MFTSTTCITDAWLLSSDVRHPWPRLLPLALLPPAELIVEYKAECAPWARRDVRCARSRVCRWEGLALGTVSGQGGQSAELVQEIRRSYANVPPDGVLIVRPAYKSCALIRIGLERGCVAQSFPCAGTTIYCWRSFSGVSFGAYHSSKFVA